MAWAAESLHCVLMSQGQLGVPDALQPWLRTFGGAPQSFQQLPPEVGGGAHATGTVGIYQATIMAQQGRLELILSARRPPTSQTPPVIVDIQPALTALRLYGTSFVGGQTPMRLALIANFSEQVADQAAATAEFARQSRLTTIPPNSADLVFAMNIRMDLPVSGVQVNRICKWSTGVQQIVQFQVGPGAAPGLRAQEFYMVSLQLDLNTVPQQAFFDSQQTAQIFDGLVTECEILYADPYGRLVPGS